MTESNNEFPTTIGADAVFKGQLHFDKGVRLLGTFEGEITSGGELLVAQGATLTGDVKAKTIRVDGQIKGNLKAETKVLLSGSAKLEGDLETQRLEVAEGAVLIGRCVVGVGDGGKAGGIQKTASQSHESVTTAKAKGTIPMVAGAKR